MERDIATLREELSEYKLRENDAQRVILDALERMGGEIMNYTRGEILLRLKRVVELGVAAQVAENATECFETVAWRSVEARRGRRAATVRDLRYYVRRMLRVKGIAERPLRAMTTRECRSLLQQAFGSSVHCYRKGRAILHSIFAYGMRHEWCDANPVGRIEVPQVDEAVIEPLSLNDAKRLLQMSQSRRHRAMRFSVLLMLYCGLRPAEVARLSPERDVFWQEKQVMVRPAVSKTGGGRIVPMRLAACIRKRECIIPRNWCNRWRALRRAAGFTHWRADALRHTFATYHAAHFRNLPELQLEMGHHDVSLLRSRYTVPALRQVAAAFWRGNYIK